MEKFACKNCEKSFKRRGNLDYHLKKQVCLTKSYECRYCPSKFTTSTAMYKHMRSVCQNKQLEKLEMSETKRKISQLENENENLRNMFKIETKKRDEELKNLKMKFEELLATNASNTKTRNITNNTNNTNNGVIINGNVALVAFGKEDMDKIDKTELLNALRGGYNTTIKLTELMHFNPNHPEYQNVFISDPNRGYAMAFDGNQWNLIMQKNLIDKIYDDKKTYVEENFDEFVKSLTKSQINSLKRWLDTDEDNKKIKNVKNDIKLLLYNSRKMVMDNKLNTKAITDKKVPNMINFDKRGKKKNNTNKSDIKNVVPANKNVIIKHNDGMTTIINTSKKNNNPNL